MISKVFILLKNIINTKIILKNPEQKDVVIFNSFQLNFYKVLFEKIKTQFNQFLKKQSKI